MRKNGVICTKMIAKSVETETNLKRCEHRDFCKLHVIKTDESIVRMRRLCENAKLVISGIAGESGCDLATAEAVVVPAHAQVLVITSPAMGPTS